MMRRFAKALAAFWRAPGRRKALALEAVVELVWARAMTLLPARIFTAALGVISAEETVRDAGAVPDVECAAEIGHLVEVVAHVMPFRALCLQQAIAVRRMLRRRDVDATVILGVSQNAEDRSAPRLGAAAHAWVMVGAKVVNGDTNLSKYTVVARFG